jgi:hypothetical protein
MFFPAPNVCRRPSLRLIHFSANTALPTTADKLLYEDAITQIARAGYLKGSSGAGFFWMARYTTAEGIVKKTGLNKNTTRN